MEKNNYLNCSIYKFERMRLGNKMCSLNGEKYGQYLYRNIKTNGLIASWDKPTKDINFLYKGEDIGCNTDALFYYKNN